VATRSAVIVIRRGVSRYLSILCLCSELTAIVVKFEEILLKFKKFFFFIVQDPHSITTKETLSILNVVTVFRPGC